MIEFTSSQKKTIATALTVLAFTVVAGFAAAILWCFVQAVKFMSPALTPLVIGLFLAMFFRPYYAWWLKVVKNPTLAVAAMLTSVLVPIVVAAWYGGSFAVDQISGLIETAPERAAKVSAWVKETFPNAIAMFNKLGVSYDSWIAGLKAGVLDFILSIAGYMSGALNWLVSLIFFVYFVTRPVMSGEDYVKEMPFLKDDTRRFVAEQIDSFFDIVVSFFQRQVVICLCEGLMYGLGFMLVGLKYGFTIGFVLGVMNLVPLFGTVVCMPIAMPLAYWGPGGGGGTLSLVIAVWLTGQFLDGCLITPRIQGNKTWLGYAGVIFSFFFWGVVFKSLLGLLLAIPLSAFCVVLWRAVKTRYIRPVV